jgi:Cof subfamily protein (haloacid dehalogenase superfamily)
MNKMIDRASKISLVVADVDGTLVTPDKVLTERACAAVKKLHDANIMFAVTSGRPPLGLKMLIEPLDLQAPMGAFNGGIFLNPDFSIIEQNSLPQDVTEQAIAIIKDYNLDVWIYQEKDWYVLNRHGAHVDRDSKTVQFEPIIVDSYDDLLKDVVKIVGVSDDLDAVAQCEVAAQKELGKSASASRSQPYYLDITHPQANKGTVVSRLSKILSIPLENIATLGDMPNDVPMFELSGMSIAMGNSSKDVQKQATYTTASYTEEGFAKAIENFVLN